MSDVKSMFCPNCGAPVSFQPGREDTFCSNCGSQLYFQDNHLELKLRHEEVKMAYEEKDKEREFELEKEKRDTKAAIMFCIGGVIFFFLCMFLMIFASRI